MPPSVYNQGVRVVQVPSRTLFGDSPRNYNASIVEFGGRRLMAYRSHRMDQKGRCAIAMCEVDEKWEGTRNHWIELPMTADEHHEDPRLFIYNGHLHLAYTETRFRHPEPYTCRMAYARLVQKRRRWSAEAVWFPSYGKNNGNSTEKNWQFFEHEGRLYVIYGSQPHVVLEVDGDVVRSVQTDPGEVLWPWGEVRGGTPPVLMPSGEFLTIFHSSLPYPVEPHWRRYYAGAYTFEAKAPFRITAVSQSPILGGSGEDGHIADPRKTSWKPFVVFPGGIIPHKDGYFVSYGINDYLTAVADHRDFNLGDPLFRSIKPRFFRTANGTRPIRLELDYVKPTYINWEPVPAEIGCATAGVIEIKSPMVAMRLAELGVTEITPDDYRKAKRPFASASFR
jgi:predicted GH43/DUF377 family glycosyl hydrolase